MFSHYSPGSSRRTSTKCWRVRNRIAVRSLRRVYRNLRRDGVSPHAARHAILTVLSAGHFYGEFR